MTITKVKPDNSSKDGNVESYKVTRKPSRKSSQRRTRSKSRVLTKTPPESIHNLEKSTSVPPVPTIPQSARKQSDPFNEKATSPTAAGPSRQPLAEMPTNREDIPSYYFQNPMSQSSIQPEKFNVEDNVPTLRKKSTHDSSIPRRKSSKRKAEDDARAKEIKALSQPMPASKRPQSNSGGLLARESRRIPGGLNRNFERPASEISLPLPDSLHSSKSDTPDTHAFKVSAFDVLSPRPTIKYAENPRGIGGTTAGPSRASTRKEKRPSITEETLNGRERIDELADELDAGDLRELMERDKRRREKKRKTDQQKLQRRLQRKSDKQNAEQAGDLTAGKNVQQREDGLGIGYGESSTSPIEQRQGVVGRDEPKSPESWLEDTSAERENPFSDPVGDTRLEPPTPSEKDEPVIETAKAVRLSTASISPPRSPVRVAARPPSNLSTPNDLSLQTTQGTQEVQEKLQPPASTRRGSDTSSRVGGSWTSFFRRSGQRGTRSSADRGRTTPSEFSNTSRDSLPKPIAPPPFVRNVRERSGTPVRTQSKFREDLPELPISPPMSRVQSPELTGGRRSPFIDDASKLPNLAAGETLEERRLSEVHPAYREEVLLSRNQSLRGQSPEHPSDALLSQSLASVDSEGSWLSGRPTKRLSQPLMNPMRSSEGSIPQPVHEEEDGIGGTTFSRKTPSPQKRYAPGGLSSQLNPRRQASGEESDYDEDELAPREEEPIKMNTVVGRHPTIISRNLGARSKEGLLTEFTSLEDSPGSSPSASSPGANSAEFPDAATAGASIHRATSVDLGKSGHARHISAGSARLLNLPPRSSSDMKRMSSASTEGRSPLPSPLGQNFNEQQRPPLPEKRMSLGSPLSTSTDPSAPESTPLSKA
jgi:hypothetical protein